ncbi:acid protease [Wolfiporia cocos MD-104 SS10]|uniref:Acid protease n=1 Tax=Wolfiporia cocos (strain MD-104) TaxID=742152 RepID=A0A2H3JEL8_WOLCO|nr:acid protease [Wolfiporia cocos MD-104 SS10]
MVGSTGVSIPVSRVPRGQGPSAHGSNSDVALSNANEYAYLVPISIGGQDFNVLLDTGSSDLWVVSSNCTDTDCQKIHTYNSSEPSPLSLSGESFHLKYLIGSVTGNVGTDTVTLGPYEISSQVLALANSTEGLDLSGTGYSGIMGLNFPVEASIPDTSGRTLIENVFASLNESDRYFAFKLGRNETGSSFTVGQLDPAYANATSMLTYSPVSSAGASTYNYWKLPLQSLSINSTRFDLSSSHVNGASTPIAVLDTGTTLILGPTAEVDRFWQSVGEARRTDAGWQVRCNRAVVVGFELGDAGNQKEYVIDPADVNWKEGGQDGDWCLGGVQANDGVFSGDWLLGDTFLRNVYVTHHAATSSQPPMIGLLGLTDATAAMAEFRENRGDDPAPPAQVHARARRTDHLTNADICGIAVASGFAFGVILTLLFHIFTRRPKQRQGRY